MKFTSYLFFLFAVCQLQAQTPDAIKTVSTITIGAPQLKTEKKIWIWLPKNYEAGRKNFPVLYVIDGQNAFDGGWDAAQTLEEVKAKTIVVGIEQTESFATLNEMDHYLEFIVSTLKPYIDSTYRTETEWKHTALLGAGHGGIMAFYAGLKYPETFGKLGCFSPVYEKYWQEIVSAMSKTPDFSKTRVYFLGGGSTTEAVNYLEHWVNTKRCSCKKFNKRVYLEDAVDDVKLWREGFKKAYLWLF